jgi:hypothetical protein
MGISHLNEIEWHVGKKKEEKVSQSVTFILDMPRMSEDDFQFLSEKKGIDSWIVRLIVQRRSEKQDLGSLYTLFEGKKQTRGVTTGGAASSVTLKIYYAAAYASERFRLLKCPAFGHDKKISSMNVAGDNSPIDLVIGQSSPYDERSHLVELAPSAFNGGNSLIGEYFLEIAPYNSKTKTLHAPFKRVPQSVVISSENRVNVASCAGEHQELQQ